VFTGYSNMAVRAI